MRNDSQEWADVVVGVELFDATGQALVNRAATTADEQMRSRYAIPPGGTLYYLYLRDVERLNGQYASHRLTLRQAYAVDPAGRAGPASPARRRSNRLSRRTTYLARGTVTSAAGCAEPQVVAAGFDAGGKLVDVAEALVYPSAGAREFGRPGRVGCGHYRVFHPGVRHARHPVCAGCSRMSVRRENCESNASS